MSRSVPLRQFNVPTTSTPLMLLRRQLASKNESYFSSFSRARFSFGAPGPRRTYSTQQTKPAFSSRSQASLQSRARIQLRQSRPYSGIPPPKNSVKFWPFFLIIGLGSVGYYLLAQKRHEAAQSALHHHTPQHSSPNFPVAPRSTTTATKMPPTPSSPAFSPTDVTVVFVLGGPGAGKGTQSAKLVETYGFTHLSAGDLLRAEQDREGSEFGELIRACIRDGDIVPMEVTVKLLENAMRDRLRSKLPPGQESLQGVKGKFLIDGFPRKMDQALRFEQTVVPAQCVLFYDCPEDELRRRLLERGKTSGREDDNLESIAKRFRTFVETSMPVVDKYEKEGRVVRIVGTASIDDVFRTSQRELVSVLGKETLEG